MNKQIEYLIKYCELRLKQLDKSVIETNDKTLEAIIRGRINEIEMFLTELRFTKIIKGDDNYD